MPSLPARLVNAGNAFLSEAHRIGPFSLQSEGSLNEYSRLIRASLNCFFVILDRYSKTLSPAAEAQICYRVSQILFKETASVELASEYCLRGLRLCARTESLYPLEVRLQLLNFQTQYYSSGPGARKSALLYLNTLISLVAPSSPNLSVFLNFTKYRYFGMTFSNDQCLDMLKQMADKLESQLDSGNFALYHLIRVCEIQRMLSLSRPRENVKSVFNSLVYQEEIHKESIAKLPVQLRAITLLLDLLISVQEDDFDESKLKISRIDSFIKQCRKEGSQWGLKCKFEIDLIFKSPFQRGEASLPLELNWLSFREFTSLAYFYCGISYLVKSWDGKHRTEKLFAHCHKALDAERKEFQWTVSANDLESKQLRMCFLSLLMNSYEMLASLGTMDCSGINKDQISLFSTRPVLAQFVDDYDNCRFSSQELVIYHPLISLLFYIWAVYYQKNGNFQLAKYYYLKIRKLYSPVPNELSMEQFFNDPVFTSFLQSSLGLEGTLFEAKGVHAQLYLLSSINILSLNLYDIYRLKMKKVEEKDLFYVEYMNNLMECMKLKDLLISELSNIFPSAESDKLLKVTILCFQYAAEPTNGSIRDDFKKIPEELLNAACFTAPLMSSMIYFIQGKCYTNEKTKPELENLNAKIQLFTSSFRQALKLTPEGSGVNIIGYLASKEIYSIMHAYRNYFDQTQVDIVKQNMSRMKNLIN
ncbi:hypothetical protein FOA43_001224 [Brettanomyces nanus]|uniref:Uncharacterized protein n=1 Tax=Eeniella nana TaxID=13502 RepID=A0A875S246_EENNA|nr:uncharacterized protein FOA43_001224 [Brettanomyces nanus]QPG73909.1 hypothetical protein FOA43_001224 [Brettanomyces nanus]